MALKALGVPAEEADEVMADIRRRDAERFQLEIAHGGSLEAGASLLIGNKMKPTPLLPPKRPKPPAAPATPDPVTATAT